MNNFLFMEEISGPPIEGTEEHEKTISVGPRLLTPDNKCNDETTSQQYLMLFKCKPKEFLQFEESGGCPIGRRGNSRRFLGFSR